MLKIVVVLAECDGRADERMIFFGIISRQMQVNVSWASMKEILLSMIATVEKFMAMKMTSRTELVPGLIIISATLIQT